MKTLFFYITAVFILQMAMSGNRCQAVKTKEIDSDTLAVKEVFGYRFVITGDFDGDGKTEQLFEHYFSRRDNKETNKFYEGLNDYSDAVDSAVQKNAHVFLSSNNPLIDTLHIVKGEYELVFGLSYLKNEGDLDGDGGDEISFVIDWADWSNLNAYVIMTYKNGKWKKLYSFDIWDWQLPELPYMTNQYGLFGTEGKIVIPENDTINALIEKELQEFEGLVRKIKTNKIQVFFMNDEAELDTMIVNLKKIKNHTKSK